MPKGWPWQTPCRCLRISKHGVAPARAGATLGPRATLTLSGRYLILPRRTVTPLLIIGQVSCTGCQLNGWWASGGMDGGLLLHGSRAGSHLHTLHLHYTNYSAIALYSVSAADVPHNVMCTTCLVLHTSAARLTQQPGANIPHSCSQHNHLLSSYSLLPLPPGRAKLRVLYIIELLPISQNNQMSHATNYLPGVTGSHLHLSQVWPLLLCPNARPTASQNSAPIYKKIGVYA
jgi:hypothetical protein